MSAPFIALEIAREIVAVGACLDIENIEPATDMAGFRFTDIDILLMVRLARRRFSLVISQDGLAACVSVRDVETLVEIAWKAAA